MSLASLLPIPRFQALDSSGDPLAGAKLYAYAAGTTTPQNTYSESTLTTANANPVVADSGGLFGAIYLSATAYKFVLKTTADVTVWTQDNVTPQSFAIAVPNVTDYGTAASGTALQAAITAIGSAVKTLLVTDTIVVSADTTVPVTLTLWFLAPGQLAPATTKTVTIAGGVIADIAQIFSGSGTVTFTNNKKLRAVYADWWGAVGDDSTDNYTAISTAYTAAATCAADLLFANGIYRFATGLAFSGKVNVIGVAGTVLKKSGNIVGITITSTDPCTIEGFTVTATGSDSSDGVRLNTGGAAGIRLRDLYIANQGGHGLVVLGAANDYFENLSTVNNAGDGVRFAPTGTDFVNANIIDGLDTRGNGGYGLNIAGGGLGTYANQCVGVVAQVNTNYGIRVNDNKNLISAYVETNTAGDVLVDSSADACLITILNSSVANPAVVMNGGTANTIFDQSTGRIWLGTGITAPMPGTNIAGLSFTIQGGKARAGATGRTGGLLGVYGGDAAGTAGNANGGRIIIQGGTPVNSGAYGVVEIQPSGGFANLGVTASRSVADPTNALNIFNGTAPSGTLTNGATFYAASGEMRVMDAAGNSTLLSPHNAEGEWVFYSKNTVTGKVLRIDMERMLRALNQQFGWNFIHDSLETP